MDPIVPGCGRVRFLRRPKPQVPPLRGGDTSPDTFESWVLHRVVETLALHRTSATQLPSSRQVRTDLGEEGGSFALTGCLLEPLKQPVRSPMTALRVRMLTTRATSHPG